MNTTAAWESISLNEAAQVARKAAQQFDSGEVELLRSGMNYVFASPTTVIRMGQANEEAEAQVDLAQYLIGMGIRVPAPLTTPTINGPTIITVWERIPTTNEAIDYQQLGEVLAKVHRIEADLLPTTRPVPLFSEARWLQVEQNLEAVRHSGILDRQDIAILKAASLDINGWKDLVDGAGLVVCHGDVHPQNVLMTSGEVVLIDWDTICLGPPQWDHAALMTWAQRWGGEPDAYDNFASGYGSDFRSNPTALSLARLRLLAPTINLASRASRDERFKAELERRMQYWRGDTEAVAWTPQ